jgi:uncharacterized membrane protein
MKHQKVKKVCLKIIYLKWNLLNIFSIFIKHRFQSLSFFFENESYSKHDQSNS